MKQLILPFVPVTAGGLNSLEKFPLIKVHCNYIICTGNLIAISNQTSVPSHQLLLLFVQVLLAADNTWLHFEDRVAYIDVCMLGVYCLNGKAVFILIDKGNDVGYLDLFTYAQFFICKNVQGLFYCSHLNLTIKWCLKCISYKFNT